MNLSLLETRCTACGQTHPISEGQFPPGVVELLRWDDGLVWTKELIDRISGEPPDYPGAIADIRSAAHSFRSGSVLVVGSMSPWIETLFDLRDRSVYVFTSNLNQAKIEYDWHRSSARIMNIRPDAIFSSEYDLVIAYSTIEHFGLGRYGDPLDPDADKKWMQMIRGCIAPGGRLLLAVPLAEHGKVDKCWHRLYGPKELTELLDGWKIVGETQSGRKANDGIGDMFNPLPGRLDWQNQPILTLVPA